MIALSRCLLNGVRFMMCSGKRALLTVAACARSGFQTVLVLKPKTQLMSQMAQPFKLKGKTSCRTIGS
jgi:hypothetical protein